MTMEPKERMLLEGVLGAVLIAFLVLASIMIVSAYGDADTKTISNSYNVNSYNKNSFNTYSSTGPLTGAQTKTRPVAYTTQKKTSSPSRTYITYTKPYIVDRTDYIDYSRVYYAKDYPRYYYVEDGSGYKNTKDYSDYRYVSYDDSGALRKYSGVIGNNVNSYEV
ncbi:MAG: hypothetical protein AABX79_00525, partial [Nanoarchaeota archaeon]